MTALPLQQARKRWWATQPARTDTPTVTARRAYLEVLAVFGAFFAAGIASAGFIVAGDIPTEVVSGWRESVPGSIDQVAQTVLCVMVPVLLTRRRGLSTVDLGVDTKQPNIPASQGIRIAAWALLGLLGGGVVTSLLATHNYPSGKFSYPNLVINLFHAAQAGFIEEIVVLAFVVTTLEQARRPRREIIAVALVLRMSYHIYYGPGVFGILVWASVFLWLYLRFRTIIPLIAVHSTWDILAFLSQRWRGIGALDLLLWFALFVTAFILWLVYRSNRSQDSAQFLAPPGWYLDPWGSGSLRWFDGYRWSPSTQTIRK